jgi:maleylpyruvate isomerase
MAPSPERSRAWMDQGTVILGRALAAADDDALLGPTRLEGWTGRHLLAHLAANAEALRNLATWARTGFETPMYASMDQRNEDIEAGSTRPVGELREWCAASAAALAADLDALTDEQWQHPVRTAQGRTVPATEVPWMRAREVMVHAVDLGMGTEFENLPEGFLLDLVDDIRAKRANTPGDHAPEVSGPPAQVAAYLSGRSRGDRLITPDGSPVPTLPRWL